MDTLRIGDEVYTREGTLNLIRWLSTPAGGMIPGDDVSCNLAKRQRDRLMFILASIDSNSKINFLPHSRGTVKCFGVTRCLDSYGVSKRAKKAASD